MKQSRILKELFELQDLPFRDFNAKLIPNIPKEKVIGIRTPQLRAYAKSCRGRDDVEQFLHDLPHSYFEENQLHAFLLSLEKDEESVIRALDEFLPYVNNWSTCDQLNPKAFVKLHEKLLIQIPKWLENPHPYVKRFAIKMLMDHFLGEEFKVQYAQMVAEVSSVPVEGYDGPEEAWYYVNMMRAWYFATALAKQYDAVLPFITENRMDVWTHNKTIQKAIESYRVSEEHKEVLRKLKWK